ncbi:MAG: hypothetical protein AAGC47_01695 [Bacteroidota bacterium]
MKEKVSIVGLGWFGVELANSLYPAYHIIGTKRAVSDDSMPYELYKLDFENDSTLNVLPKVLDTDYLVLNIPPNARASNAQDSYRKMLDLVISHSQNSPLKRLIFISSTGVFCGNSRIVDEFTTPEPMTTAGKILYEAEKNVLAISKFESVVLRPSGLVGGQRHPAKYLAGRINVKGQHQIVNLVHRDDLITTTSALIKTRKLPGGIFHACSSEHPNKKDFYQNEVIKLGMEPPVFDENDMSIGKEISANWSKQNLGISYKFEDPFRML